MSKQKILPKNSIKQTKNKGCLEINGFDTICSDCNTCTILFTCPVGPFLLFHTNIKVYNWIIVIFRQTNYLLNVSLPWQLTPKCQAPKKTRTLNTLFDKLWGIKEPVKYYFRKNVFAQKITDWGKHSRVTTRPVFLVESWKHLLPIRF